MVWFSNGFKIEFIHNCWALISVVNGHGQKHKMSENGLSVRPKPSFGRTDKCPKFFEHTNNFVRMFETFRTFGQLCPNVRKNFGRTDKCPNLSETFSDIRTRCIFYQKVWFQSNIENFYILSSKLRTQKINKIKIFSFLFIFLEFFFLNFGQMSENRLFVRPKTSRTKLSNSPKFFGHSDNFVRTSEIFRTLGQFCPNVRTHFGHLSVRPKIGSDGRTDTNSVRWQHCFDWEY